VQSRMRVQRDNVCSLVVLMAWSIPGALVGCANAEPEPSAPSSAAPSPAAPSPPRRPFDAQVVTVDGEKFWEQKYLDQRIRVPLSDAWMDDNDSSPSWTIGLPPHLPTQPSDDRYPIPAAINVRFRDAKLAEPQDTVWSTLLNADPLTLVPDEVHPEWKLIYFRSPHVAKEAGNGRGFWIPADASFRARDGRRLVIYCSPYYTTGPQTNPHPLRCRFYVKVSETLLLDVFFRGTFLPDWKSVYDTATFRIEERVSPLDDSAPRIPSTNAVRDCDQWHMERKLLRRLWKNRTSLDPDQQEALQKRIRRAEAGLTERCGVE
jgi:hypothetical protein